MSDLSASSRGGVVDFVFEIPEYGNPLLHCLFQQLRTKSTFYVPTPPQANVVAKLLCCDISVDLH